MWVHRYVHLANAPIWFFVFHQQQAKAHMHTYTYMYTHARTQRQALSFVLCTHTYYVCYFRCTALAQTYHNDSTAAAAVVSSSSFIFVVAFFFFFCNINFIFVVSLLLGTLRLTGTFSIVVNAPFNCA